MKSVGFAGESFFFVFGHGVERQYLECVTPRTPERLEAPTWCRTCQSPTVPTTQVTGQEVLGHELGQINKGWCNS